MAASSDVVQLLLNGSAFSSDKTNTLDSNGVTAGYIDFDVAQGDLGSAGIKAVSAKITSGSVVGKESPSLVFTLTADTAAPTAVPSISAIGDDTGSSATDYITLNLIRSSLAQSIMPWRS